MSYASRALTWAAGDLVLSFFIVHHPFPNTMSPVSARSRPAHSSLEPRSRLPVLPSLSKHLLLIAVLQGRVNWCLVYPRRRHAARLCGLKAEPRLRRQPAHHRGRMPPRSARPRAARQPVEDQGLHASARNAAAAAHRRAPAAGAEPGARARAAAARPNRPERSWWRRR